MRCSPRTFESENECGKRERARERVIDGFGNTNLRAECFEMGSMGSMGSIEYEYTTLQHSIFGIGSTPLAEFSI